MSFAKQRSFKFKIYYAVYVLSTDYPGYNFIVRKNHKIIFETQAYIIFRLFLS